MPVYGVPKEEMSKYMTTKDDIREDTEKWPPHDMLLPEEDLFVPLPERAQEDDDEDCDVAFSTFRPIKNVSNLIRISSRLLTR